MSDLSQMLTRENLEICSVFMMGVMLILGFAFVLAPLSKKKAIYILAGVSAMLTAVVFGALAFADDSYDTMPHLALLWFAVSLYLFAYAKWRLPSAK